MPFPAPPTPPAADSAPFSRRRPTRSPDSRADDPIFPPFRPIFASTTQFRAAAPHFAPDSRADDPIFPPIFADSRTTGPPRDRAKTSQEPVLNQRNRNDSAYLVRFRVEVVRDMPYPVVHRRYELAYIRLRFTYHVKTRKTNQRHIGYRFPVSLYLYISIYLKNNNNNRPCGGLWVVLWWSLGGPVVRAKGGKSGWGGA